MEVAEPSTFIKYMLSIAAVAAKAQQDPHCCWSRMGVTFPAATQSTLEADGRVLGNVIFFDETDADTEFVVFMRYEEAN